MKKRFLFLSIMIALVLSLCGGAALAAQPRRASLTISMFTSSASRGSNGEVKIFYDMLASGVADEVGISSIVIYKGDSTYVTTITGTTRNGLIRTDAARHRSTYTYYGDPDTSYYAIVTGFATIGSDSDSRTRTTDTV